MTTVYFVRHAASDHAAQDERTRPLTPQGRESCAQVCAVLRGRGITRVFSSPYRRAVDTVAPFAREAGLAVETVEEFRERRVDSVWVEDFMGFCRRQWADFDYALSGGETLAQVQRRNVAALHALLRRCAGESIVIGTHGTALSTVLNHYDSRFDFTHFCALLPLMPCIVRLRFEGETWLDMARLDLPETEH